MSEKRHTAKDWLAAIEREVEYAQAQAAGVESVAMAITIAIDHCEDGSRAASKLVPAINHLAEMVCTLGGEISKIGAQVDVAIRKSD